MASSPATNLVYKRLDPFHQQIRILTLHKGDWSEDIRCSLRVESLVGKAPVYNALSYRWGDNNSKRAIFVNGKEFLVTENLETAFRHLRRKESDEDLWVDQVCINQGNGSEKNHQIPLMRRIYTEADTVLIWLGESDGLSDQLADILSSARLQYRSKGKPGTEARKWYCEDLTSCFFLLANICQRDWWSRVWIVQECVLPVKPPLFRCGSKAFTFAQIQDTFNLLMRDSAYLLPLGSINNADLKKAFKSSESQMDLLQPLQTLVALRRDFDIQDYRTITTIDCLRLTVGFFATRPHDYVYGFLGLLSLYEASDLNLGYDISDAELFRRFMTSALLSGAELDRHGFYQALRAMSFEKNDSASPSWVPDLSSQAFSSPHNSVNLIPHEPRKTEFHPIIWSEFDLMIMHIAGFRLDSITKVIAFGETPVQLIANIARCQDYYTGDKSSWLVRRLLDFTETTEMAAIRKKVNFRRLFTCNYDSNLLQGKAELLDELWDKWVHSRKVLRAQHRRYEEVFSEFKERSSLACRGRCWIMTKQQYVGIAIPGARVGDVVMFPSGFVMPLVLRRCGDHYKIIGGAYIDGLVADGAVDKHFQNVQPEAWKLK
jgi:hypothetical protein